MATGNGNGSAAGVINRSVTRDNFNDVRRNGVWNFFMPLPQDQQVGLPAYWSPARDYVLRSAILMESNWANAVSIATTKMASLAWKLDGKRIARWQELLLSADSNQSWVAFLSKQLQDYLGTDNGQFTEIVRATNARGSRVAGLMHLDSWRCRRTGDPDFPVIYVDRLGREHLLRDHQVMLLSDMPDASETLFGVGHCAAERAWSKIRYLAGLETYVSDKVTGRRPLAIHIVNGGGELSDVQIEDAVASAKEQAAAQGYKNFMGAVIITTLDPTATPSVATIPLAELPDGFDAEKERKDANRVYANAIGIDPQELDPDLLASRALGTGAQSRVIEEKEAGKGLAAWRQMWTHNLNQRVLPGVVTFTFMERDLRDEMSQASVTETRARARGQMLTNGEITPQEARQLAVDADDLPKEFGVTPDQDLSDDEKPTEDQDGAPDAAEADTLPSPEDVTADQAPQDAPTQKALPMPPALARLMAQAESDIAGVTAQLQAGALTVAEWQRRVTDILTVYHTESYRAGARAYTRELTPGEQDLIALTVADQVSYLQGFAATMEEGSPLSPAFGWDEAWNARAEMYAQSIGASYWDGRTKGLPLPAQPKDGTTLCLTNCKCKWKIVWLDEEAGDADCYWLRDADESCQTCIERAAQWNPLKVRGGSIVT